MDMTYEDEQAMNFLKVLGIDSGKDEKENETPDEARPTTTAAEDTRRSIKLPALLHRRLKVMAFWTEKNGIFRNPSIPDIIEDALSYYLDNKYPEARTFIDNTI